MPTTLSNLLLFVQKILTFFQQKTTGFVLTFKKTLTNDVVNFKTPAPDIYKPYVMFWGKTSIFSQMLTTHE